MRARSEIAALFTTEAIEATFITADPARASWLAMWHPTRVLRGADTEVDLVQPVDGHMQRVTATVLKVAIPDAIDALCDLPADARCGESVHVFAVATRLALQQISRGLLQPSLSPFGIDTWRLGPLDSTDTARRRQLIDATPATAHTVPASAASPDLLTDEAEPDLRIISASRAIDGFGHAIADAFARTPAAPIVAGHSAFAATRPITIDARAAIESFAALLNDGRSPLATIRVNPPDGDTGSFSASLAFQSRRDPNLMVMASALWAAPDHIRARFSDAEAALLLAVRRGSQIWPPLSRLLESGRPTEIELDDEEVDDLLGPLANRLGAAGLSVLVPSELFRAIDLTPIVASASPVSASGRGLDLASLLELRWDASVDGERLTEAELLELSEAKRSVIRLRDQWVRVDAAGIRKLNERRALGTSSAVAAALGAPINVGGEFHTIEVVGPLAELGERLQLLDTSAALEPPSTLEGELRPYQERGLAWLSEMDALGLGGVLADDMGLGKTIQIIALHLLRQERSPAPTLVIAPASVVGNWEREINRFAPSVKVVRYHGPSRSLGPTEPGTMVLTTYGVARRDAQLLNERPWGLTIGDEAQAIKNPYSRTARALRTITSEARFALTGTPVQNQLSDLWAILDWTTPGLLGPLERFRADVAIPVERDRDPVATEQLTRLLRPFLLRRQKTDPDIAPDLPPKTETDEVVPLTVEQAALYRAVVTEIMSDIGEAEGINRRGLVLKLVTQLKQVCNHPAHLVPDDEPLAGRSGKLGRSTELLETIRDSGDAALVFTQYVAMGRLLEQHLEPLGFRTLFLHGSLSLKDRERMVAEFQAGEADVFIISLRAGGVGLNLTAATHVIHYDRWWNPAVEDQASDRAWRIGQDRPVQIHRLISEGTIEDRIAVMLNEKRALAEAVVGSGEGWISELDDDSLADLVALSDYEGAPDALEEADF
ncbi:MAG: hypothetical protein ACI8TP_002584 [Acidimicrobiales bacterium]|jgi:hypothetical protein